MALGRDLRFDTKNIAIREAGEDYIWDGRVKNLVYNSTTMEWEAQTNASGGGAGGGTISADTSSVETRSLALKSIVDESSTAVTYVGEAATGAATSVSSWRIKRLTQTATILTIEWASGNGAFNKIWDNRAALTYS